MAKISYDFGDFGEKLEALGSRDNIRRIVEAGSAAAIKEEQARTIAAGHVVTGKMLQSIGAGPLHEDLNSAWQYVYPGGYDERNQNLAVIASVINYGYGGRKTPKTGDRFLTGKKETMSEAVEAAMRAEIERIKEETMR